MNLAVFLPGWIGDVVMATPAFRALRDHHPGAHIVGVGKPYVTGVVEGAPWFDEMLAGTSVWTLGRELRRRKIDLAVLFPNSFRTGLAAWLGGCRRRVGYARYLRSWLLTDALRANRTPSPVIDAYNALARHVGCPDPGYRMELFTTPDDEAAADRVWRHLAPAEVRSPSPPVLRGRGVRGEGEEAGPGDKASSLVPASSPLTPSPSPPMSTWGERGAGLRPVIGLNPGAAFGAAKCWPTAHWVTLARTLIQERGALLLVLGGPKERALTCEIARGVGLPECVALGDVDVPLSLGLSKALVRRLDVLVTTDSGPRHFASAFQRPVVTLFGPTHIAWTETYQANAVHLQLAVPCGPCQQRLCPEKHHRCMTDLTPARVAAATLRLLSPLRLIG